MKKDGIMKHLFKSKIFKNILSVLSIFLLVKLIWVVIAIQWLPSNGVYHTDEVGGKSLYYRVKMTPNEASAPVKKIQPVKIAGSIKDIVLQAVYSASDSTVVTIEYKRKTKILERGDTVNGFVLEGGGSNYATFSKESKMYRVDLKKGKKGTVSSGSIVPSKPVRKVRKKRSTGPAKVTGEVVDAGDHKIVDKSLLTHYANNMDDIYKNIGITEVKKNGAIKGFKVTFVRRGSPFSKLGIKRGDIIKSINGQEITSYNAAFETYKNIKNVEGVTLVIKRGKEELELEYEIN
jgi:general secretion pathway protein C